MSPLLPGLTRSKDATDILTTPNASPLHCRSGRPGSDAAAALLLTSLSRQMPRALTVCAALTAAAATLAAPVRPASSLAAQEAPEAGARSAPATLPAPRVRLHLPGARLEGLALGVEADALLLQTAAWTAGGERRLDQRWVPLRCVERAERSAGHGSRWRAASRVGVLGLLAGAATGVLVAKGQERPVRNPLSSNPIPATDNARLRRVNVTRYGSIGLGLGAVIGYRLPTERWRRVDPWTILGGGAEPGANRSRRGCSRTD
jgi:hypothetical protein